MDALTISAIASLVAAVGSVIAAVGSLFTRRTVDRVRHEVTTLNGKTIAVIADEGETRRIEQIPQRDRTTADQAHLDTIPPEPSPET